MGASWPWAFTPLWNAGRKEQNICCSLPNFYITLKYFFRIIISLEDILLPWMVWTLGCFLRVTPEQADGIWAMEKHLENSSPSYTPGICVEETFWFPILAQFRREREEIHPQKRNAANVRECLTFSPFKCSWWVILARRVLSTLKNTLHNLLSVVVFATVMSHTSQMIWGFPRNSQMWVGSSLWNLWQVFSAITFSLLEQMHGSQHPDCSGWKSCQKSKNPASQNGPFLQLYYVLHTPPHHSNVL